MERETVFTERYMIREAAKQVGVETHVLRYWEKELSLEIPKNEMRHRYYTNNEIALLRQIKYLKDQGFHLKSIRMLKEHISEVAQMDMARLHSLRDRLNSQLMAESAMSVGETASTVDEGISDISADSTDNVSDSDFASIFTGNPVGEPAGVATGEITGKRVNMKELTAEKTNGSKSAEIKRKTRDDKEEKTQLLELELAEPLREKKNGMAQRPFDVVQGGRAAADKGFTVFFKNGNLAVTGKETLEKENFISTQKQEQKKETREEEKKISEKKEFHVAQKENSKKDSLVGQAESQEIDNRMEQFRMIMGDIIGEALRENNKELARDVGSHVSDKVIKEMDFMMRSQQEEEEERYRKLDETIRSCQRSRQEAAAGRESVKKKRRGLFLGKRGKEKQE